MLGVRSEVGVVRCEGLLSSTECSRDRGQSEYIVTVGSQLFIQVSVKNGVKSDQPCGQSAPAELARRRTRGRHAAEAAKVRRSTLTPPDPTALHCIANAHRRAHAHSRGPREDTQIARSGHTHVCAHETDNVIVTPMAWTRGAALPCTRPNATLGQ